MCQLSSFCTHRLYTAVFRAWSCLFGFNYPKWRSNVFLSTVYSWKYKIGQLDSNKIDLCNMTNNRLITVFFTNALNPFPHALLQKLFHFKNSPHVSHHLFIISSRIYRPIAEQTVQVIYKQTMVLFYGSNASYNSPSSVHFQFHSQKCNVYHSNCQCSMTSESITLYTNAKKWILSHSSSSVFRL